RIDTRTALQDTIRKQATRWSSTRFFDPAIALELAASRPGLPAPRETTPGVDYQHQERGIPSEGRFSESFTGPGSFFATHEVVVDSFSSLTQELANLSEINPGLRLVWRGQQNANWGLHSSLYRRLLKHSGVVTQRSAEGAGEASQIFPDESAMLQAELAILDEASDWRMSDLSALELMARLQHHGGPSRLLDVTRNPLIAAWFAVESGPDDGEDARLFALSTAPVGDNSPGDAVLNEVLASTRYPFWVYDNEEQRRTAEWGTGARRRIWVPPAYDARIAAQNAAFLLEGVPMFTRGNLRLFERAKNRQWHAVDVAAATSIYARPANPHKRARPNKAGLAPVFTFRIEAQAKDQIRQSLTQIYGYTTALLYPDIQGMSTRLRLHSDWIEASR
ncbi:FRG domain-containing protein, partial [Brevibacterium sp. GP-SGM9]|uniref:FRG domain-containing protein n=1 Tax=Brevibacterium sp. GP-SGM9 TaxID=3376990 RepID=UPI0039A4AD2A